MREVGAFEAKNTLGNLLDMVAEDTAQDTQTLAGQFIDNANGQVGAASPE